MLAGQEVGAIIPAADRGDQNTRGDNGYEQHFEGKTVVASDQP